MLSKQQRYRGALLGLACGDAVGTTLEFAQRGTFTPITDMVGGGPFHLELGQWTDDTSMALCLAASLVHCQGFDAADQMDRYSQWRRNGYMSSNGRCFDIGGTVYDALRQYEKTGEPFSGATDPQSAGNGSLMRLVPVVMFYHPDKDTAVHYAGESSRTTHGTQEAVDVCKLFAALLSKALDGQLKAELLTTDPPEGVSPRLAAIAGGEYLSKTEDDISSSGYVVDTLEAALWCFSRTVNFRDAILSAANLGGDADTTAAVVGQIAGAHYGVNAISNEWLSKLALKDEIAELADALCNRASVT